MHFVCEMSEALGMKLISQFYFLQLTADN